MKLSKLSADAEVVLAKMEFLPHVLKFYIPFDPKDPNRHDVFLTSGPGADTYRLTEKITGRTFIEFEASVKKDGFSFDMDEIVCQRFVAKISSPGRVGY